MPKVRQVSAVCTYDFTWFNIEPEKCKEVLSKYCKKWCFQQEKAPSTNTLHLQGRFSLKVRERVSTLRHKFPGAHLSVTSSVNRDNDFYVMKEDTRVAGPWKFDDPHVPGHVQKMQSDYGHKKLFRIDGGGDFTFLMADCAADNNELFCRLVRRHVDDYKDGKMYGVKITETDGMYERSAQGTDACFSSELQKVLGYGGSLYRLPCFVVFDKEKALIENIWVRTDLRRNGIATFIVKELAALVNTNELVVYCILEKAMPFWDSLGSLRIPTEIDDRFPSNVHILKLK